MHAHSHVLTTAQAFDALVDGMLLTAEEEVSLLNSLPFPTTSDTNDTDAASWLRPLYASRLNKYDTELPVEEQFDGLEEVGLGETPYVVRTPHTAGAIPPMLTSIVATFRAHCAGVSQGRDAVLSPRLPWCTRLDETVRHAQSKTPPPHSR